MRIVKSLVLLQLLLCAFAAAQQTSFQDPLLDRFVGHWIARGTIEGKETTHEVTAAWVLAHQYLQFHEVSREKNPDGSPVYEAIVFIGHDEHFGEYVCLWLDVTGGGGLNPQALGRATRDGSDIPFLFHGGDGSLFHTTFHYDSNADTWQWLMDGEQNGAREPFARLVLSRQ